ncbi:hypothetical protein IWW34DRAFT_850121 [Fusarium oxysporum f. sp. albedinis]|nr:hypothetical protein IWW34DRAFT_850121 [Fusarium oxysporum f. sp. albedinis]
MAIHGQTAVQGYDESVARSKGRQAACTNCAKAKQACDGQQPCSRCQKKQATCVYGMRNKRNQQARQVPSPSTASSTSQSVTILPSMDDVSALPSTHQNFFRPAPSMDDDNNTSYSVTETQQTFKETRALPVSLELADYASSVSENQNLLWDQAGVDNLNAPGTSDPLPGMDLDSLAFGSLPGLSFYAFDFGSLLPSPSTSIPRTRQGPTINFHQQYGSEVPQLEEGCQIEAMAELRFPRLHDHHVPPKPYTFPDIQSDQLQSLCRGIYCHIPQTQLLQHAHQEASDFFYSIHKSQGLDGGSTLAFLPFSTFNAFIQLYFEHFHPSWPFIHPSTLAQADTSWILYVGIAAVGTRYVAADAMEQYRSAMMSLHRDVILHHLPKSPKEGELTFSQSVLLYHISLAFDGSRPLLTNMYYERSILTTLCHSRIATKAWLRGDNRVQSADGTRWETWVATQSNYWFIYSVWFFECLTQIFLDVRPHLKVEDIDVPLPEQGSLWSAGNRSDWESVLGKQPGAGKRSENSLKDILYDADTMQQVAADIHGMLRILLMVTLFVEESTEVLRTKSWLSERISNPSALARSRNPTRPFLERNTPLRLQNRIKALDADFTLLQPKLAVFPLTNNLSIMQACIYHEIHIIRHVSLQELYALTGWQASKPYVDIAERDFKLWLNGHKPTIRKCLWHAATLFSSLHSRRHMTLWEPLCFLNGATFIWAYLKYADGKTIEASSPAHTIENQKALRLDQLTNEDERNAWIEHGFNGNIHVTGIGNLNPGECPNQVLEELYRCLIPQTGTANLAGGIAKAIMQVCRGLSPSF